MDARDHQVGDSSNPTGERIDDRFPEGMRVLAVDDDLACLKFLEASLRKCNYEVTAVNRAKHALEILKENKNKFDMVISDVWMPEMDGFQLLQQLAHEIDLPVVMVSSSGDNDLIKKGISHGACCYLVKPVTIEVFRTIWQHVFRRKNLNSKERCKSFDQDKLNIVQKQKNGEQGKKRKYKMEDDENDDDNEDASTAKKNRITWTEDMKKRFEDAYHDLGPENAIPSKLLELMNSESLTTLTRAHISSHLQKYRKQLNKGIIKKRGTSIVINHGRNDSLSSCIPLNQMLPRSNYPTGILVNSSSHLLLADHSPNMRCPFSTSTIAGHPLQRPVTQGPDFYVSTGFNSSNTKSFDNELRRSSVSQDNMRSYSERWQAGIQGSDQLYQAALLRSDNSNFGTLPPNNFGASSSTPLIGSIPNELYSISSAVDLRGNAHRQDYNHNWSKPSLISSSDGVDPLSQTLNQKGALYDGISTILYSCDQFSAETTEVRNSTMQTEIEPNESYLLNPDLLNDDDQVQFNFYEQEFGSMP